MHNSQFLIFAISESRVELVRTMPSEAKIMSKANNSQFSILNYALTIVHHPIAPLS